MSTDPTLTEPWPAPEIFADGFSALSVANGVAKFTFFSRVSLDEQTQELRLVARVTLPLVALMSLSSTTAEMVARLTQQEEARPN